MPKEKRVSVPLDRQSLEALNEIAEYTQQPIGRICANMIKKQLEWDEDAYYLKMIKDEGIDLEDTVSIEEVKRRLSAIQD
jgi:hypothetical protein